MPYRATIMVNDLDVNRMSNKRDVSCTSEAVDTQEAPFMATLFRVGRHEQQGRWIVLVEGRLYGEYLGRDEAVADAIDAVNDTRASGGEAEVWNEAMTLRLY